MERAHRPGTRPSRAVQVLEQQHHRPRLEVQQRRRTQVAQVALVTRVARLSAERSRSHADVARVIAGEL